MNPDDKDKIKEKIEENKDEKENQKLKLSPETLFWLYYDMGEKRSLRRLARENNETFTRIKHLSQKYKWTDKINQINEQDASVTEEVNKLASHAEIMQYVTARAILQDPKAKASDKLKALDYIATLMQKAQDIKRKKIVVMKFDNIDELRAVVDKINAERHKEVVMRKEFGEGS